MSEAANIESNSQAPEMDMRSNWQFLDNSGRPVALEKDRDLGRQIRRANEYLEATEIKKKDEVIGIYRQRIIELLQRMQAHKKTQHDKLEDYWVQADASGDTGARLGVLLTLAVDEANRPWMRFNESED